MINNDLLRRISKIFKLTDDKIRAIFALNHCTISEQQLADFFRQKDDTAYQELSDVTFASFLNGLIIEKRGLSEGPQRVAELQLNNNLIFNKIKIALAYKAEEVIEVLKLGGLHLTKYELSALFRNVNHKRYRECTDDVLSTFLKGLKIKNQA